MNLKYKGKNLKVSFDISDNTMSRVHIDDKKKILKISAISKVYFLEKNSEKSYSVLSNDLVLYGNDIDIDIGIGIFNLYSYSSTFGFDFDKICDHQNIILRSGLYIDNDVVKVRRSVLKKMKSFTKESLVLFKEFCLNKMSYKYDKCTLLLLSGILNNFIYKYKKVNSNNIKHISKEFVQKEFDFIYYDMVEFFLNKKD